MHRLIAPAILLLLVPARIALAEEDPYAGGRWIMGDVHQHVTPADSESDVRLGPHDVATQAARAGMEWVVLTPHLWPRAWRERATFLIAWKRMRELAARETEVTLIPGVEYSENGLGHFGVSGVDVTALEGDDFLAAASGAGAFVVVNHPFAVPTRIPGVRASQWDLSYRPWTGGRQDGRPFQAVEIWNVPLGLANLVSRPGGQTGEQRALAAADALARAERRPVVLVGGSDNHRGAVTGTTWVFAPDARPESILAALRAGRTCVGGAQAGTLRARGDGGWVGIGGRVTGARIELAWRGSGEVIIDGASVGEHEGSFVHQAAPGPHTYRVVVEGSRSGFIYANFASK
jgi:hypothetical protein